MNTIEKPHITRDTMIPELLATYPQARSVLDRLGLRGCGGPLGPHETLGYFARAHGVDESSMLAQISTAITGGGCLPQVEKQDADEHAHGIADTIYRPFFTGGIITILTAGATWGMILLWRIAFCHTFKAASAMEINAHAQAQVYGWMGFFIMGFAYQAFPRFWHTSLTKPRLALAVFSFLCVGVFVASATMPLAGCGPWFPALASSAAFLELIAVVLFAFHIGLTFKTSGKKCEPYVAYIFTALTWFILASVLNLYLTFGMMTTTEKELPFFVNVCQPILRDMQFHGLGITMILGVSLRTLPGLFGLPGIPAPKAVAGLVLLTAGVIGEIISFTIYKQCGLACAGLMLTASHLSLLLACLIVVLPFKLWLSFPDYDRAEKFIKCAFVWLFISLFMLAGSSLYAQSSGMPISHAYSGAVRHAITVGFISLMIMGYSSKVVPTLNGIAPATLSRLFIPFVLINLGCFLRVAMQTGTDLIPGIFPLLGISGSLEVIAIAIWAVHLVRIAQHGSEQSQTVSSSLPPPGLITPDCMVAQVLDWYPETESIFVLHGFHAVRNPVLRKTVARRTSIERACRMMQLDVEQFVKELNSGLHPLTVESPSKDFRQPGDWKEIG